MFRMFSRIFPMYRIKKANKAIQILIVSDSFFFSSMALAEVVFSVFIVQTIPGATVKHLGIGNAIFMLGILLTEPLFSKFYDSAKGVTSSFYGFVIGNLLKSVFRLLFVVINSVNAFYIIYFLLGIIHSIEYPSFSKLFTRFVDKDLVSTEWGYKDVFVSLGKIVAMFMSGYIAISWGYNTLFILSAIGMFVAGVILPLAYKNEFLKVID